MLYEAVRDNLATLLAEAGEVGRGLPRYVERDFARYLECGVLARGFARVRCESCKDELLVAFSCKGRGVCPSCNAKRAHVTAVHLVEQVLPHVPYRQWTLSFPHRVRWVLLKDVGLLSDVLTVFLRAVFALQRRRARRQGLRGGQVGAVSFIQFFGSALRLPVLRGPLVGALEQRHPHLLRAVKELCDLAWTRFHPGPQVVTPQDLRPTQDASSAANAVPAAPIADGSRCRPSGMGGNRPLSIRWADAARTRGKGCLHGRLRSNCPIRLT